VKAVIEMVKKIEKYHETQTYQETQNEGLENDGRMRICANKKH